MTDYRPGEPPRRGPRPQGPRLGQPWPQHAQPYAPNPQRAYPPGRRARKSWAGRHKVLTAIGGVLGLFVVLGVIGAATSSSNKPAVPVAAVTTTAPPATQKATAKAVVRPKASRAPGAHARDAEDACDARGFASGDIYVRMTVPGEAPVAQELGGEWVWDVSGGKCLTSMQMIIAAAPQTPGNCTQVGYAADNPGYDPNATPAAPLEKVTAESGPAC